MNVLNFVNAFFSDGAHWHGYDGIPQRLLEHVQYSALALALAAAIGLPVGLLTGHTGKGGNALAFIATAARALPSFGLLVLIVIMMGFGLLPVMIPLVVLAVPPILVTTYGPSAPSTRPRWTPRAAWACTSRGSSSRSNCRSHCR